MLGMYGDRGACRIERVRGGVDEWKRGGWLGGRREGGSFVGVVEVYVRIWRYYPVHVARKEICMWEWVSIMSQLCGIGVDGTRKLLSPQILVPCARGDTNHRYAWRHCDL